MKRNKVLNCYLRTKTVTGIIKGNSMFPALKVGWKIKMEPSDKNNIKIGNIISFGKDVLTCHRIIGKFRFFNNIYLIHKGDNSSVGGIFAAKGPVYKAVEVFNENNEKIDETRWANSHFKRINNLAYFYLILYLVKRYIFSQRTNKLTTYSNRFCWRFLLKC